MQTAIKLPHYLDARERFLRAMGKEQGQQRRLFTLFGVDDAGALEESKSLSLMAPALTSPNIAHSDDINALSCPRT